jgi:DNA-binding response OmpR family regulator
MKNILYVEDNQDTAEAVKIILTRAGFDVETVCCGKDCIKRTTEKSFDIILLDIMLPDMSGWDIFEELKRKTKAKFAFLSAIPVSEERMKELKKAGIYDYITKPFEKADLIRRVHYLVSNSDTSFNKKVSK